MPLKLMLVVLAVVLPSATVQDCEKDCQTTIVVTDCDGAPVANATAEVKLCCGNNETVNVRTNSAGEAVVNSCLKDICRTRITLEGFAISAIDRNGCSTNGKNSRCDVKICPR